MPTPRPMPVWTRPKGRTSSKRAVNRRGSVAGTRDDSSGDDSDAATQSVAVEAFELFDSDNDGVLTPKQALQALKELGVHDKGKRERSIKAAGNPVDLAAFCALAEQLMEQQVDDGEMDRLFRLFDQQDKGHITAADVSRVAADLGERYSAEDVEDMLGFITRSESGLLQRDDFRRMLERLGFL
ncbi:hypothetical protein THASP1DRAFT_31805 [Thamnocephalis sphaerospora]|uniref:EF-hand domain-containing protein n=1 Tax=Thamnocephalis sphaerospora TaxID=78915 RepID=A0A4P9XKU9_9FUNG|nr:hypothetical protein THASP1DRAFT_31805 [Thamnocephalis sphaerospora]|eukprot:RKP06376.1 hypothetical protein THASP1DRAFT_31805 [Thamnocephalis sphaerospora]